MSLATIDFEVFSIPFQLATNDKKFGREFLDLNSALTLPSTNGLTPIKYSVIKHKKYFSIRENEKFCIRTTHRWPLYLFIMMRVRDSLYEGLKDYLFLHSGAVARDNRAILLIGPSGAGKSTLTTALLNYGYRYVTDEVVVVTISGLRVLPFQRPIYLYGWLPILSSENNREFKAFRFKERYGKNMEYWQFIVPQNSSRLAKESSFDPGFIIFPRFSERRKRTTLKSISKAEAVIHLMQNGWNMSQFGDYGLQVCSELVRRAECYRLDMGDLKEACELIGEVTDNRTDSVDPELLGNIVRNREFS